MCTGIEILPLVASTALTAAGSVYNWKTEQNYIDEVNRQRKVAMQIEQKARNEEARRQNEMEDEQFATFEDAVMQADPEKIMAKFATGGRNFAEGARGFEVPMLQGQATSGTVSETIGKTVGNAISEAKSILGAQERLAAQDASFKNATDAVGRMGQDIQTVNSDRRRSAQIAQMETTIPEAEVTKSDSLLGDILIMAGTLVGGMPGMGPTAAAGVPLTSLQNVFAPGFTPTYGGWMNPFA